MSENTVETTTNGPSLESILWAAAERWNDEPGLVDREEFAAYICDAWGGAESPTEEFVARFFDGPVNVARPHDMAEAVSRASRGRMHVYNFDLNRLEYVVIEDKDQLVLVGEQGQFALPNTEFVMRAIERAIIPGSTDPIGTNGQFDRKQDGTPRAYFVRSSGEIVAVDVDQISRTVQQMQLELKPVFSPVIDDAEGRLLPFNPTRTSMMPNREVDLLRQDERIASWTMPKQSRLVNSLGKAGMSMGLAPGSGGLPAPAAAANTVLLLLPDGTLARPVIGSGSRWRDMVSDWTARAAAISLDATQPPAAVMDERKYAIQTDRVVAIFSGVRTTSESSDAPGELGYTSQTRGEAIAAVRMLNANIQALGDDDLAQAILGGAKFVSGLAAPIMADTRPGTGFWLQPEVFFDPSSRDREYAAREADLRSAGYSNASLETQMAAPSQEVVAINSGGSAASSASSASSAATSDPWANWALQAGGELTPNAVAAALIGRDVEGGTVSGATDPSTLALFARRGRNLGAADLGAFSSEPLRIPSERVAAFRAPDGQIVFQPQANTQVRFASAHRSVGAADAGSDSPSPSAIPGAPTPRQFSASIGTRSGALPATALAALATALDRTAAASGYKLPRLVSYESASDAVSAGDALSSSLPMDAPQRSRAMLAETPLLSGSTGRMVLSMPFPSSGEVVVGRDLDEALSAWMVAPAIPVGDTTAAMSSSGTSWSSNGSGAPGAMLGSLGGAAGGAIAGGLALQGGGGFGASASGGPSYNNLASLYNATVVSGGAPASSGLGGGAAPEGASFDPTTGQMIVSSTSGATTSFGSNASSGAVGSSSAGFSGGSFAPSFATAAGAGSQAIFGGAVGQGSVDLGSLHGAAFSQAQRASFALQMPAAAETLSSRATLARLPKLLARALESSGGWLPGSGTPLPSAVQEFALSGPFDLPELAAIGAFPDEEGPGLISTRVLNPGEEEISIPMPLWTQMGRGRLSSTDAVMASPRMRPGFAPPLGVYKLVAPEPVDFTAGAPENTPGVLTLQGPTEMGLNRSLAGGVEATKMGGQFVLGHIPLADGETVVSRRGRIKIGAPLSGADESAAMSGGASSLSSFGQPGSFATGGSSMGSAGLGAESFAEASGASGFGGQALSEASSGAGAALGGDAPAGRLVSSAAQAIRVPGVPDLETIEVEELSTAASAPSSSGRPFAGALRSALKMRDEVGSRLVPGTSFSPPPGNAFGTPAWSGTGSLGGPAWGSAGSTGNLVSGAPAFGSGGGVATGVAGPEFGGTVSSLASEAPRGSLVAGGGSSMGSTSVSALSGAEGAGSSMVSGATAVAGGSSSGTVAGLPPGAWSGAKRDDPGYAPWIYGSRFSPSEQSRGGVDLFSGSRLAKPAYPALPAMLRFRYIGAPLWWTSATGSWASGSDDASEGAVNPNSMARSLRSGLSAANSAAAIWRSIFVAPGRQDGPGAGGSAGSDAGAIDQTWDRNADSMASLSSKMALIAVGVGGAGGAAVAAGGAGAGSLAGPETVYVAMDAAGRAGTSTGGARQSSLSPSELSMKIVAAIPPSPPPLADMAAASSTGAEVRPRHSKAGGAHHGDEKSGDEGVSRSKIEGSVDAIAQRIYHRIVRRLDSDRERFGG